eukprot:m.122167 g.122167  ORF g.122167 m.122167 type:complete len:1469 (-) comp17269_c0_seq70:3312-7718(-)
MMDRLVVYIWSLCTTTFMLQAYGCMFHCKTSLCGGPVEFPSPIPLPIGSIDGLHSVAPNAIPKFYLVSPYLSDVRPKTWNIGLNLSHRGITGIESGGLDCYNNLSGYDYTIPCGYSASAGYSENNTAVLLLNDNNLTQIPPTEVFGNIVVISMKNNFITDLENPDLFARDTCLTVDLSNNLISEFAMRSNPFLAYSKTHDTGGLQINLASNRITKFGNNPDGWIVPTNYYTQFNLYLGHNHIKLLPPMISVAVGTAQDTLGALIVDLSENAISVLPNLWMSNCSAYGIRVNLDDNLITQLGPEVFRFHLDGPVVSLQRNKITSVSAAGLFQSGSCLSVPGASTVLYTASTLSLDLSGNPITNVGPELFNPVPCVYGKTVYANQSCFYDLNLLLNNISITTFDLSWFRGFKGSSLSVQMQGNFITQLSQQNFGTDLVADTLLLDFSYNNLTMLGDELFSSLVVRNLSVLFDYNQLVDVATMFGSYTWHNNQICSTRYLCCILKTCSTYMSTLASFAGNQLQYNALYNVVQGYLPAKRGTLIVNMPQNNITYIGRHLLPHEVPLGPGIGVELTEVYELVLSRNPIQSLDAESFVKVNIWGERSLAVDLSNCWGDQSTGISVPELVWCRVTNPSTSCVYVKEYGGSTFTFNFTFNFSGTATDVSALANITGFFTAADTGVTMSTVDLSNCSIEYLPADVLSSAKIPLSLRLENNRITALPSDGIDFVGEINLSHNEITAVEAGAFRSDGLSSVDVSYNRITMVDDQAFALNTMLQTLDLSHNQITVVSLAALVPIPFLRSLCISDNPIWAIPAAGLSVFHAVDAENNIVKCSAYFPDLEGCSCTLSHHAFDFFCGYGRCVTTQPNSTAHLGCMPNVSSSVAAVYTTTACEVAPYTQCESVTACYEVDSYRIQDATVSSDNICANVTICSQAFRDANDGFLSAYEVQTPTETSDRLCSICSECLQGFSTTACTATTNTECSRTTKLSSGDVAAIALTFVIIVVGSICVVAYTVHRQRQILNAKNAPFSFEAELRQLQQCGWLNNGDAQGNKDAGVQDFVDDLSSVFKPPEIRESLLQEGCVLGTGQFGEVVAAVLLAVSRGGLVKARKDVALKRLKGKGKFLVSNPAPSHEGDEDEMSYLQQRRMLMAEAALLAQLQHPNITRLIGVVSRNQRAILVMELCACGSLDHVLSKHRGTGAERRAVAFSMGLRVASDVANAMAYLEQRRIVHRDLAARNVLVTDTYVFKISDFGMGRRFQNGTDYYRPRADGLLPFRWCALEVLDSGTFSTASDVWSYGITMYELFTWADMPYAALQPAALVHSLRQGFRLDSPFQATRVADERTAASFVYQELMLACWAADPDKRPSFHDLARDLTKFLEDHHSFVKMPGGDGDADSAWVDAKGTMQLKENLHHLTQTESGRSNGFTSNTARVYSNMPSGSLYSVRYANVTNDVVSLDNNVHYANPVFDSNVYE